MNSPVIVALDFPGSQQAQALVDQLDPKTCRVKVGKELFTRSGPDFVKNLVSLGFEVFLDLKYHDIPNTVAQACRAAAELGVWMINIHAMGGLAMMQAARKGVNQCEHKPLLIGVTVLTSMAATDLNAIGISDSPLQQVKRLALLAQEADLDGVVCSPQEVTELRKSCGPLFQFVTPGVRPVGTDVQDQKRVMTPPQAIAAGANFLVMGRPITQAADPVAALAAINQSLQLSSNNY